MSIQPNDETPLKLHPTVMDRVLKRLGSWVVALLTHNPTRRDGGHQ